MKTLVINGTGSIGSAIVKELKSSGCEVIFTSNHNESDKVSGCITGNMMVHNLLKICFY